MSNLQIVLFGNPTLTLDGEPATGFVSNKAVALVYYVAATNRLHSRETLAALLWPDMPEARAKKNLRDVLSNLRRVMGEHLVITRQSVILRTGEREDAGMVTVDAIMLERLLTQLQTTAGVARAHTAKLEEALALIQGEFLEGFYIPDAPLFEEWVVGERSRYSQLQQQILGDLVLDCEERGAHLEGVDYAARRLALDPLEEGAHRQLMSLYAATGQYAAALAQYERCCEILYAELGAEPSPETTELFDRIHVVHEQPTAQLALDEDQTPFVGRAYELAEIQRRLATPTCRLLTLVGLGGVGKTRLARQIARYATRKFLDGVYFVHLTAVKDTNQLVTILADAVGLTLSATDEVEAQLLNFLRAKQLLLILDNAEVLVTNPNLAAATPRSTLTAQPVMLLTTIVRTAPDVKLLITSREALNLRAEEIVELSGLAIPQAPKTAGAETLLQHDAIQLFLQCAHRVSAQAVPDVDPMPLAELQRIARICQLVEGMPLAIELAAGWVHTLSFQEILQEIETGIDLLQTSLHDVPERHRSLRAVFDYSWALISPSAQAVLQRLSIFQGGFSRKAAQTVAGATLPILTDLVRQSFLQHAHTGHYTIHSLLRQYASEHIEHDRQAVAELQERHSLYYTELLRENLLPLQTEQFAQFAEALFPAMNDLRAAYEWALTTAQFDRVAEMADGLYFLYLWRNRFLEGAERFRTGVQTLAAAAATDGEIAQKLRQNESPTPVVTTVHPRARALGKLAARWGMFCQSLGQYEHAQSELTVGLTTARAHHDQEEVAFCLWGLAKVGVAQATYEDAVAAAEESYALYQASKQLVEQARVLHTLGVAHLLQSKSEAAYRELGKALALAQHHGLRWTEADCAAALGEVRWNQGDHEGAQRYFTQAANRFRLPPLTNFVGVANTFNKLGFVAWSQGDLAAAAKYHEEAYQTLRELGNRQGEGQTLSHLGRVAERQQRFDDALQLYQQALTVNREIGDRLGEAISVCNLAFAAYRQGDLMSAQEEFTHCRDLCQQIRERRYEALVLACLGLIDCLYGNYPQGEQVIGHALQIAQTIQDPTILGYCWTHLGYAHLGQNAWADAQQAYQQALESRQRAGDRERCLDALAGLTYIAHELELMDDFQQYGAELVAHVDEHSLASALLPVQIHYMRYCLFNAGQSDAKQRDQATEAQQSAKRLLQRQAASITDLTTRRDFLSNPVVHRPLMAS